ncbi:MAG: ribosomal protein S18-alanine N-acetyltransferase [Chloroflexi bacterium]|nr:ribosomal protein S18-alanine N-acetyltransferase [Chloroflexota bacterium]MCI0581173.1 ribosomal protein S18-alanine N-acetyltransferase [Chloroflexota bacterium]MCI0643458.1 ribosomal protein S18-alanine N-acetyltransferase [Chloroflexota bacterium]MCI0727456.1 ribosomal protein S18-alanine N-acetyltransferase [Chloroflexota bacterium]
MLKPPPPYRLRAMQLSDIEPVMAIERTAFVTPWSAGAYQRELTKNQLAHYQVLTVQQGDRPTRVIGYAGYWVLADEVHISTIAVENAWRGRGLGELLLLNMLFLAFDEAAQMATLEVRKDNVVAQALYRKYGFEVVGERRHYYKDRSDALIMTVAPLEAAYRAFLREKREALWQRLQPEAAGKR